MPSNLLLRFHRDSFLAFLEVFLLVVAVGNEEERNREEVKVQLVDTSFQVAVEDLSREEVTFLPYHEEGTKVVVEISIRWDWEGASFVACRKDSSFLDEVDQVAGVASEQERALEIQVDTCREVGGSFRVEEGEEAFSVVRSKEEEDRCCRTGEGKVGSDEAVAEGCSSSSSEMEVQEKLRSIRESKSEMRDR